ncbi:MAG: tetratricopeptide repeat protein, partial [Fibrobacterota bacterium]|nr:tetratricopeptide repeat protein [Fibrobacterota bacterium]
LAEAYLKRGLMEKAEAEYRGLLVRSPESGENWAGLGAALVATDPVAASECYRKAAFYSNQAEQRSSYIAEQKRLASAQPRNDRKAADSDDAKLTAVLAAPSALPTAPITIPEAKSVPTAPAKTQAADPSADAKAKAAKERLESEEKFKQDALAKAAEKKAKEENERLAKEENAKKDALAKQEVLAKEEKVKQDALATAAPAPAVKPKPFDLKAFQDSVYQAELEKRLAALKLNKAAVPSAAAPHPIPATAPVATVASAPVPAISAAPQKSDGAKEKEVREAEAKANAEKQRLAKEAEEKAKEEKEQQERLAKSAEKKAKEDQRMAEEFAHKKAETEKVRLGKEEKLKQEALATAEKARQDSLAKETEKKALAEKVMKEKAELVAKVEKARQDSLAKEAEKKAKEERERFAREQEAKRIEETKVMKLKQELEQRERLARERRDRHERAIALFREGRMDSSALVFKAVLADSPVTDAFYYAGRVSLARNENGKAMELFQKAGADKSDLNGLRGKALMGLGKHKEASAALESQFAKTNEDTTLMDLVEVKRKLGDETGAIIYLEKLAEKRPGVPKHQEDLAAHFRAKGDRQKATERYTKVFILHPGHPEANYWLGLEAAKAGDNTRAVPFLERAVAAFPTRADAYKALAKGNAALGRKEPAWETHKKAFALAPADLELARGKLALARESHPTELPKAYEDVLRIAPEDGEAAMGLANLRYSEGNHAAAEKYFRIACKDSKDPHALALFGRSLLELKKVDEAAVVLQKAVDLGETDPSLRLDLARIRIAKGDFDWAEALLKDLAKKATSDPEPLYWQGQIALKRQQVTVAEEFFRKSNQLKPDEARYAESLARLLRDKDDWKQAVAVLSRAEAKLTHSGRLLYGDCLAHGGDWAKAQSVYAELYRKEASAGLLSRRMDLVVRMGKPEQAVELSNGAPYLEATEVRFSLAKAQLALADAHLLQGDPELAVDLMKKVMKTDDHKPEYHYYLGLAYFNQNRHKRALDEFTDALRYRVDYPEALYRKGICLIKIKDVKEAENSFGELTQHADPLWKARGLYGLAMVFEAQGKPEAVQHHLERSIAASPLADAMAFLSRVHLSQSRVVEAQDWARKAQSADISNESATVALTEALTAAKRQTEAMELARQGLRARPLSCGLLVQSAKLNFQAGRLDSTLAAGNTAIKVCPEDPMGYFYAGIATHGSNRPKEAKQYFKSFRKMGGDKKMVPGE